MADTIAVHHAGPGEAHGGYPRVKIWCDIVPNLKMKNLFDNVANGIEGIANVFTSKLDDAHIELILEPTVNVEMTTSAWIEEVNKQLREFDEHEELKKFFQPDPNAMIDHSATSTFHGADRSD